MNTEKTNNQIEYPNEVGVLFTKHNDPLASLSKEDLIKVIAHMHDVIQEWDNGWGLEQQNAQTLKSIGDKCMLSCHYNNDWDISHLTKTK